jgi:hypothetical protein
MHATVTITASRFDRAKKARTLRAINDIRTLRLEGYGYNACARALTEAKVPTLGGLPGAPWHASSVLYVVRKYLPELAIGPAKNTA